MFYISNFRKSVTFPIGSGLVLVIQRKSKLRLDVSFGALHVGYKHDLDGMIGE